jgi:hypothetical protein
MAKPDLPRKSTPKIPPARLRSKGEPPRGPGVFAPIMCGAAILLLAVIALPVALLLLVGIVPSIVAYIIDHTPRRTLTLTVGPLNLAGAGPYCLQLWFGADTVRALGQDLTNVWVWLVMYSAAAVGWLLHLGMPLIVRFVLERAIDGRKAKLVQIQNKLRAEWGDEVEGGTPGPAA